MTEDSSNRRYSVPEEDFDDVFDQFATPPLNEQTEVYGKSRDDAEIPESIGRYRIIRTVGIGSFGRVFLARDGKLEREVAIKVPHPDLVADPLQALAYLSEAKTVASLDHPHIVPVYDAGSSAGFPFYVVTKYIAGEDLRSRLNSSTLNAAESVQLVAAVADALHHAHTRGFVHRDVKPGNVLLGESDYPYLVDFGLALREQDIGLGPQHAGTPAYMSPEQARGEGHRVDGRSDIFSLGVLFYELLVGRRPFLGSTATELLAQLKSQDVKPLRQVDDSIHKELERICLKALAKRASDRYTTALDMAEDLRSFLSQADATVVMNHPSQTSTPERQGTVTKTGKLFATQISDPEPPKVIPKGLRSFDEHDADFFLELLPGPRDRNGMPDSIRFWKTRIEETDADKTFSVGLIYGPSGSGKSSFVKAGLLPRLSSEVTTVYIEATPDDTERRLLRGLRKSCSDLDEGTDIRSTFAAIRHGRSGSTKKVLIVLDQFEQWLQTNREGVETELVEALRQCDGAHLQCVVMVRDDFWMAATRFMRELEVRLIEAHNSAAVDLFPIRHARKILRAFGAAFGTLPADWDRATKEQNAFVTQAVKGLSVEGKVICVRLALFAEMMKGKVWTPTVLREVGGTTGVGATFLEETFSASTAPPKHRFHQVAARKILKALLPDLGSDIKGQMKSYDDLLSASEYESRREDFNEVLQLLDSELRLITPTDPEGIESVVGVGPIKTDDSQRYYQLTHDYLVHSLRDWLTRKQKETSQGRAELALADRASVWKARPENRQLPSLLQWMQIRWHTDSKRWTESQQTMMTRASRVIGKRAIIAASIVTVVALVTWQFLAWQQREREQLEYQTALRNTVTAVDSLQAAQGNAVPYVLEKLDTLPREMILAEIDKRYPSASSQLKLSLAYGLAYYGREDLDALIEGVVDPDTKADEVMNIVAALARKPEESLALLKEKAEQLSNDQNWVTKTRISTVALYLNDHSLASEMLKGEPNSERSENTFDPIERTRFIKAFADWPGDLALLAGILRESDDPYLRSGITLSLSGVVQPSHKAKMIWHETLSDWYENAPDGGTHSASVLAMNRWQLPIPGSSDTRPITKDAPIQSDWWQMDYFTMVRIPRGSVVGIEGPISLEADIWMGDCEVTVAQFERFMKGAPITERPLDWEGPYFFMEENISENPVQQVSWYDAILFCNWLSDQHGFERVYEVSRNDDEWNIKMIPGRFGFRLPLENEWEYACRANTTTRYSFGHDENDLDDYDWYWGNSGPQTRTHHVGVKLCNAWGLFDMNGNVREWCWDRFDEGESRRVGRGGTLARGAGNSIISNRFYAEPASRYMQWGFRVVLAEVSEEEASRP